MNDDAVRSRGASRDRAMAHGFLAAASARVIRVVTSIGTLGIAARAMSTEEFGLVATLMSVLLILTVFDLGVGSALTARVAATYQADDPEDVRTHIAVGFAVLLGIGLAIAGVGIAVALTVPTDRWAGDGLDSATVLPAVILTSLLAGLTLPATLSYVTLTGMQRMVTVQIAAVAGSLLTVAAVAAAVLLDAPPWGYIAAMGGAPLVVWLGLTLWVVYVQLPGIVDRRRITGAGLRDLLRTSGFFAVINASNAVGLGTGTVIVASVRGPAAAAVFSVVVRMFTPVSAVANTGRVQLLAALTEAMSRDDVAWVRSRHWHWIWYVAGITTAVGVLLVALGRWLARIWVGPDLVPPLNLLVWMAVFTVLTAVATQASVVVAALGRLRGLAALSVANAVLGTAAAVVLAARAGLAGAIMGSVAVLSVLMLPGALLLAGSALRSLTTAVPSATSREPAG